MSSEDFSVRKLDPARAHGVRIAHSSPQIFGAIGIPNFANLSLDLVGKRKITDWKDPENHSGRTIESVASSPRLGLLNRPSLYAQAHRTRRPRGSTHD